MWEKILLTISFFMSATNIVQAKAEDKQKVVIGLDINVPPMGFLDSKGNVIGFDIDFAKETFKLLNKEIIFQPIDWDSKELELNTGKIDVIWNGLSYMPERAQAMLLTKTYMQNNQVFIVKNDSMISKISDLKQKSICVQKGSSGEVSLRNSIVSKNVKSIIALEDMVCCLNEVRFSKSDATLVDEVIARYYLSKNNLDGEFKILEEPLSTESYVIAVKKGNTRLKDAIEGGLSELIKIGKAKEISERWFGKDKTCFKEIEETCTNAANENSNFSSELLKGLVQTLKLFLICFILALPLGGGLAFLRGTKLKFFIDIYTTLMRGTPLLLQIFFMFYGLPIIFPGLKITNRFLIGVLAFVLNYAAYYTEIFRGGLKSIDIGQYEAIKVLQITKFKATCKIILPQVLKVCLPSICNETINLVKDTALIFSIGIVELLTIAKNVVNQTANITAYIVVFAIYLTICAAINLIFKVFENKIKF